MTYSDNKKSGKEVLLGLDHSYAYYYPPMGPLDIEKMK
jgi:hypothetical protein